MEHGGYGHWDPKSLPFSLFRLEKELIKKESYDHSKASFVGFKQRLKSESEPNTLNPTFRALNLVTEARAALQ